MFYENEFDKIWDEVIKGLIDTNAKKLGINHKSNNRVKHSLRYKYNKYKDILVKNYMVLDTVNVDRHKIAACMLKAILVVKPLKISLKSKLTFLFSSGKDYSDILKHQLQFKDNEQLKKHFLFFNEYLAISVAVSILESYIQSDNRQGRFKHGIVLPAPFPELDEDYLLDLCIGLHYTRSRNIDTITYANVFFLWEKYSCRKVQCDNIVASYKSQLRDNKMSEEEIEKKLENAKNGQ